MSPSEFESVINRLFDKMGELERSQQEKWEKMMYHNQQWYGEIAQSHSEGTRRLYDKMDELVHKFHSTEVAATKDRNKIAALEEKFEITRDHLQKQIENNTKQQAEILEAIKDWRRTVDTQINTITTNCNTSRMSCMKERQAAEEKQNVKHTKLAVQIAKVLGVLSVAGGIGLLVFKLIMEAAVPGTVGTTPP